MKISFARFAVAGAAAVSGEGVVVPHSSVSQDDIGSNPLTDNEDPSQSSDLGRSLKEGVDDSKVLFAIFVPLITVCTVCACLKGIRSSQLRSQSPVLGVSKAFYTGSDDQYARASKPVEHAVVSKALVGLPTNS
jgi:hypothetical protein